MSSVCPKPEQLYAEDPKLNPEDVKILQEWMKKQPHLPEIEEAQVIMFLYSCCHSIEQTKVTIDYFYTQKSLFPNYFDHVGTEDLRRALTNGLVSVLPNKTPENFIVVTGKLLDLKPENFDFQNLVRMAIMEYELYAHQNPRMKDAVVIIDLKGFSFSHLVRLNLVCVKHFVDFVQMALPIILRRIYFVNALAVTEKLIAILKPFLKVEIYNLIQIHPNYDSLHKQVPKGCLPEEYGGALPSQSVFRDEVLKKLLANSEFFQWLDSQVVDETKRIGKLPSSGFGQDGTFKKLELD